MALKILFLSVVMVASISHGYENTYVECGSDNFFKISTPEEKSLFSKGDGKYASPRLTFIDITDTFSGQERRLDGAVFDDVAGTITHYNSSRSGWTPYFPDPVTYSGITLKEPELDYKALEACKAKYGIRDRGERENSLATSSGSKKGKYTGRFSDGRCDEYRKIGWKWGLYIDRVKGEAWHTVRKDACTSGCGKEVSISAPHRHVKAQLVGVCEATSEKKIKDRLVEIEVYRKSRQPKKAKTKF